MKKFLILSVFLGISSNLMAGHYNEFDTSCTNIKITKASVSAECNARNGGTYKTAIRLRGVNNYNGVLTVEEDSRIRSRFHESCRKLSITNGTLSGECKNNNRQFVASSLDLTGLIKNYNGTLIYP